MKRLLCALLLTVGFLGASKIVYAQPPTFSSLVVAAGNGSATVTFNTGVASNNDGTGNLTSSQFTITVSASTNGGTVSAGPVVPVVTHTAGNNSALLTFTIVGVKDGSEIITVQPSSATSIYRSTSLFLPMSGSASIPQNLNDQFAPTLLSIVRATSSPTNAGSVNFTATFSEAVQATTVDNTDFSIIVGGSPTGTSITGVLPAAGNATVFTITVNTGSGNGNIGLDRLIGSSVTDVAGNVGTGQAVVGQVYAIEKTPPEITNIVRQSPTNLNTNANTLVWDVTFSEPVLNIDATDFTRTGTTATFSAPTDQGGNTWRLTLTGGNLATLNATVTLGFAGGQNITDGAGNALTNLVPTGTNDNSFIVDNLGPSAVTINQAGGQADPEYATGTANFTVVFTDGPVDGATFAGADFVVTGGTATYTMGLPTTSDGGVTWNVVATITASGTVTPTLNTNTVSDLAGNVGTSSGSSSTDGTVTVILEPTTPATSLSITAGTVPQTGFNVGKSGGNGTSYLIVAKQGNGGTTFLPVDGTNYTASINANFTAAADVGGGNKILGYTANGSLPLAVTGFLPNTAYSFTLFAANGPVTTANFNTAGTSDNTQSTATCVYPTQGTAQAVTNITSTAARLNWTRSTNTAPNNVTLIVIKAGAIAPSPTLADGTDYTSLASTSFPSAQLIGGDGFVLLAGLGSGAAGSTARTLDITGLDPTQQYTVAFYQYNSTSFCYQTPAATRTFTTGAATGEVTLAAGGVAEPAVFTISGTSTATPGIFVFDFVVTDPGDDDSDTRISSITITQDGANNTVGTWGTAAGAIQGARLSDGSNSQFATSITASTIVFGSMQNGGGDLGHINDGSSPTNKTYTLTVWLKNPLPAAFQNTIDGLKLGFLVDNSSFTHSGGSTLAPAQSVSSAPTVTNVINVLASVLAFTVQPPATATATQVLSTQPIISAKDAFGNFDLSSISATVTAGALGPDSPPTGFVNGFMNFSTANTFNYQNVGGPTAMTITTTSTPIGLTVNSSTSTTVTASTALTGGGLLGINTGPNLINSSTNQAVFGFKLNTTGSTLNFTDVTITTTSDPDLAFKPLSIKLIRSTDNDAGPAGNTLISSTYTTPGNSIDFSPFSTSINGSDSYFFIVVDIQDFFPTSLPTIGLSLTTTDFTVSTGNKSGSTQTGTTYTLQDNTLPTVVSIVPALVNNGPNGISNTTPLTFTVTFSEPVTGVTAADFVTTSIPPVGSIPFPPVVGTPGGIAGSGAVYTVTVNGVSGTGQLRLDMNANALIVDPQPNGNVAGFTSGTPYTVILPEPTNASTGFLATAPALNPNSSVKLDWTNPLGGQQPTHVLIVGIRNGVGTFPTVADASLIAASGNWNTAASYGAVIIDYTTVYPAIPGIDTYTIDNLLLSGAQYDFRIYPYVLSPNNSTNNVDYKTTPLLAGNYTVPLASASTIVAGTTAAPATISSVLGGSNTVFSFKIIDDNAAALDNAPTLISNLVINKTLLGLNSIANWTDAIASAQLVDITQNAGAPIAGTVLANDISFVLTTGAGNPGFIGPNLTKEYELRITLRNPFTASLDNQRFDFTINPTGFPGSITYAAGSSQIANAQLQSTGAETIQVIATGLRFTTQPAPTSQLILTNFSTPPVIRAVDANGNVDVNFTGGANNVTFTTPGSITTMNNPGTNVTSFVLTPTNGVVDFGILAPNLRYNDTNSGVINGTLIATGGGLSSLVGAGSIPCSAITVNYSNATTLTSGTGIANISSIAASINVFSFTVTDDGGAGGDGAATKISSLRFTPNGSNQFGNFQDLLASATLSDGVNTQTITSASGLNATDLIFSAIPNAAGNLGNVPDSSPKTYTLSITLNTPLLGGSLPFTADNLRLVLDIIRNPNITLNATGSTIPLAAPGVNSGTTNGVFQVFATKLTFTTQPPANYLVNVALSDQGVIPVVEALDVRNNRDLDYVAPVTTTTSVVSRSGQPTTFRSNIPVGNGGIITNGAGVAFGFGDMQLTTIGTNAAITVTSTTPNANAVIPTAAVSSLFDVKVGQSSTIGTPVAIGPVPSTAYSAVSGAPATSTGAAQVFSFRITDDAVLPNDGNATRVTQITFRQSGTQNSSPELSDWRNAIAGAILSDGVPANNRVIDFSVTPAAITANSIVFSAILNAAGELGHIPDSPTLGASFKTYTLSIWLKNPLAGTLPITIDGKNFGFDVQTIADVITDPNGTALTSGTAITPTGNTVNVVASKINYLTLPFTSVPSLAFPTARSIEDPFSGTIGAEAVDVNGNRDLNYTGTISGFGVANSLGFTNNPNGQNFSGGTFSFNPAFKYTTTGPTLNADGSMTMTTSGGANPTLTSQTSTAINIFSNADAYVYFDPAYVAQVFSNHVNQQASALPATDPLDNSLAKFAQLVLSDGGGANFLANGTHVVTPDLDRAFTQISSITFTLTGAGTSDLRTVALYDNLTNMKVSGDQPASGSVTFNGLTIQAADGSTNTFSVRGTFNETIGLDRDQVQFRVAGVTWSAGSRPFNYNGGAGPFFGGVNAGSLSPNNQINVVATSLDFVTQPNAYAGVNEVIDATTTVGPLFTGIVRARDKFANLDTDFNSSYALSAPAGPIANPVTTTFTNGILNLVGMRYAATGDGRLVVTAASLTSNNSLSPNSIPCTRVDVINVGAVYNANGLTSSTNLKGGSAGVPIFGVDLTPAYFVSTFKGDPTNEPALISLTFSFDVPYKTSTRTTLKDLKIFESTGGTFLGSTNVTNIGGTVVPLESVPASGNFDRIKVTFSTPRPLYTSASQPSPTRSYFLTADIDVTATNNTPKITPELRDVGYLDDRIEITEGSALATVIGTQYGFASTRPPSLVGPNCVPASGTLNVSAGITSIGLTFDVPVLTFDGVATLHDRETDALVANLVATNGLFINGTTTGSTLFTIPPVNTLNFTINLINPLNPLTADRVYYVRLPKGTFDPTALGGKGRGTGVSDDQLNLFGGITYNGVYYFKIASAIAPKMIATDLTKYEVTPSVASLNASFDQKGKAYYLILTGGSAAPSSTQIRNGTYGAGQVSFGAFNVTQLSPNLQFFSAIGNFNVAPTYDVWMLAENDSPTPVVSGIYGSASVMPKHGAGLTGPTFSFTQPLSPGIPIYQICPNSFSILSQPIVLKETANGTWGTGSQNFNILLPTGFDFDVTYTPNVVLIGADFGATAPVLTFFNSTILNIQFTNSGSASLDRIVISDMRVEPSSSSAAGDIKRFGGVGLSGFPDNYVFGKISASALAPQAFTNSYTTFNDFDASIKLSSVVTSVPDNFFDQALARNAIKLIPTITPSNDYNASFFDGSGVTDDVLSLTGVNKNTAFDITMSRTDLNGCFLNQTQQYTVYDNTNIIPKLINTTPGLTPQQSGPKQPLNNVNFVLPSDVVAGADSPSLLSSVQLNDDDIAGYKLDSMVVKVPKEITAQSVIPTSNSQIIFGTGWQNQLNKVTKIINEYPAAFPSKYRDYKWDYSHVLNAKSETAGDPNPANRVTKNPYDNFNANTPANSNNYKGGNQLYYTGGSLGYVDFIAKFQSTADLTVFQPLVQRIQLFVPAVPIIEVVGQSYVKPGTAGKPDIYVFCQEGSDILFNGYPAASPGKSKAYYSLYDSATNAVLFDGISKLPAGSGFTDNANSNGSATLVTNSPTFLNGYKTIRVEYTYQDDDSPAIGKGNFYIQISPNPVPDFTTSMLCEDITVQFTDATGGISAAAGVEIAKWSWNFFDPNSANNTDFTENPTHIYNDFGVYGSVTLSAETNYGCRSVNPAVKSLTVGGTPVVAFDLRGVSTADTFEFTSSSTTPAIDPIASLNWTFGNAQTGTGSPATTTYTTPGKVNVNLLVTSQIGCTNNLTKEIVVLSRSTPTDLLAYEEKFESSGGNWQTLTLPSSISPSSWAAGTPTTTSGIQLDPALNGTGIWKTNLTGPYNAREVSALYSPSFDLSQLDRPMLGLNTFRQLAAGEGVVLEYSIDNKNIVDATKTWAVLGKLINNQFTGVGWYNGVGLSSQPGNQTEGFGWTGGQPNWIESKHILDAVLNQPRVVFRFALATQTTTPTLGGFALDNIRVGNRTRTILVENFKNSGRPATSNELPESNYLKTFKNGAVGTKLVKINYHVGFPQADPFNQDNPADPSSRALYYSIASTPLARLDGGHAPGAAAQPFSQWGEAWYDEQTLKLANARITPNPVVNNDGSISIDVNVEAISLSLPANTILHVALVEKSVTSLPTAKSALVKTGETDFEYVLKKLLPSGAGTVFGQQLAAGSSRNFTGFTWTPEPSRLYLTTNDLAVIAFVQNDVTKEVFQAEIVDVGNDPPVVTGLEDIAPTSIEMYPNPANKEFVIKLPAPTMQSISVDLIDQVGKIVHGASFSIGEHEKTLNIEDYAAGIYILQLRDSKGSLIRKKLMIAH